MDNLQTLHSESHEIVDHRDEVEVAFGASSVRPFAAKTTITPTTAGSGWYHDAAIEAADRAAIEARSNPYHH